MALRHKPLVTWCQIVRSSVERALLLTVTVGHFGIDGHTPGVREATLPPTLTVTPCRSGVVCSALDQKLHYDRVGQS